jgi:hypothetical protein
MRVPEIQARLREIAEELRWGMATPTFALGNELDSLAAELSRRKGAKGPPTSQPMTAERHERIKTLAKYGISQQAIATLVGVNAGRVSEVLKGKRT